MPELELLEKACPEVRRFREENHGRHRLVVRTSRCGRDNLGLNLSVGILEQAWNCLAKAAKHMKRSNLPPSVGYVAQWQSG